MSTGGFEPPFFGSIKSFGLSEAESTIQTILSAQYE